MPISKINLENLVKKSFPDAKINIIDLAGDEDHYALEIKSSIFKDKSRIEQHKIVNNALKECLGTTLHALTIKTSS